MSNGNLEIKAISGHRVARQGRGYRQPDGARHSEPPAITTFAS